jgi:hypothetical protein
MFGIDDFFIILPYVLGIACVLFSAWYGLKNWSKDDKEEKGKES